MKISKINFVVYLFIITLSSDLRGQAPWKIVAPSIPHLAAYSSVVVGNKAYFWCSNNIVFSTSDGGQSLTLLTPYGPVNDVVLGCCANQGIAFADSLIGYVADIAHGEFRTTDGGITWQQTGSVGSNIELVVFASTHIGWKFGDGGTYRTTDAGATWTFIDAPYAYGGIWGKAFALDENRVWLAKSFYNGRPSEGSIWYSSNSGITWNRQTSAPTSDSLNEVTYQDLRINSSGIGIAIGSIMQNSGTIIAFAARTSNFGATWTKIEFTSESPKTILAIEDSIWIIFGGGSTPYMRKSIDSGKTWSSNTILFVSQGYCLYGSAVYIPSFATIVVSTSAGVFKSQDMGNTFVKVTNALDVSIKNTVVDCKPTNPNGQIVIANSYGDKFLFSEDGGITWTQRTLPSASDYSFSQTQIAQGVIYSIPDQLHLYKSIDSGKTWQSISVPVYSGLRALRAYDKDNIVLQGYRTILYSLNGGNSWRQTPFPGEYWLNVSAITGLETVIGGGGFYDSTGTHGILYQTSNAGFDWHIVDLPREIIQLKMVTPTTGFAMSDYEFYRTTNGGQIWTPILSSNDYFTHYEEFSFSDSLNGILRVSFDFMETHDGGNTWIKKELGLPLYNISSIDRTQQGKLFVAGDGMLWCQSQAPNQNSAQGENRFVDKQQADVLKMDIFPNPFNPATSITLTLESKGRIQLSVYDILGRKVSELLNSELEAGIHSVPFDGSKLSSGVYIFYLRSNSIVKTQKALLLK